MKKKLQKTIQTSVSCQGIGVHSGQTISLTLKPAPFQSGIHFVRTDVGITFKANWRHVVDTQFCTTLGEGDARLATVEHLLAALSALGIDNIVVEVDGPELPILDGSSLPFIHLLQQAGIKTGSVYQQAIHVLKPVRVEKGESWLEITPADTLSIHITVPLNGTEPQEFTYLEEESFEHQVAAARTFSLLENVEKMQAMGLIKGGSLDNAVVLKGGKVLNPEGLRFKNECARHKALDILGDISLADAPLKGAIKGHAPGHTLNYLLIKTLMQDKKAWKFTSKPSPSFSSFSPIAVFTAPSYSY